MANWAAIPSNLLLLVADRLPFAGDHVRLRSVNNWWRTVVPKPNLCPLLCVYSGGGGGHPRDSNPVSFLTFTGTDLVEVDPSSLPPIPVDRPCVASHRGWLAQFEENTSFRLLNPVTGAQIELPPFPNSPARTGDTYSKLVLSSDPSAGDDLVIVFYERCAFFRWSRLGFCRPRDGAWTPILHPMFSPAFDAAFYAAWFVFVSGVDIFLWNSTHRSPRVVQMTFPHQQLFNGGEPSSDKLNSCYLSEYNRELYMVVLGNTSVADAGTVDDDEEVAFGDDDVEIEYAVYDDDEEEEEEEVDDHDQVSKVLKWSVEVFKLQLTRRNGELRWWKVRQLNDLSFLVGSRGQSLGLCTRNNIHHRSGFLPNTVYFPYGNGNSTVMVISNSLTDGSTQVVVSRTRNLPAGDHWLDWSYCMWFSPSLLVGGHGRVLPAAAGTPDQEVLDATEV